MQNILEEDDEYTTKEIESFKKWKASREFFPITKLDELIRERPNLLLPECGHYSIIAKNKEDLIKYILRFSNVEPLVAADILKEVFYLEDEDDKSNDNEEYIDEKTTALTVKEDIYLPSYNQFMDFDERLEIKKLKNFDRNLPSAIIFRKSFEEDYSYPLLLSYSFYKGEHRGSSDVVNATSVYELKNVIVTESSITVHDIN